MTRSELPTEGQDNWTLDGFIEAFKTWSPEELPQQGEAVFPFMEALGYVKEMQGILTHCMNCKFPTFHYPHTAALMPGHCYTEAGVREVRISGFCEWCFDRITAEVIDEIVEETQASPEDD